MPRTSSEHVSAANGGHKIWFLLEINALRRVLTQESYTIYERLERFNVYDGENGGGIVSLVGVLSRFIEAAEYTRSVKPFCSGFSKEKLVDDVAMSFWKIENFMDMNYRIAVYLQYICTKLITKSPTN